MGAPLSKIKRLAKRILLKIVKIDVHAEIAQQVRRIFAEQAVACTPVFHMAEINLSNISNILLF